MQLNYLISSPKLKQHRQCNFQWKLKTGRSQVFTGSSQKQEFFNIEFGAPAAPQEIWENFAKDSRYGLLSELDKNDSEIDVVMAGLHFSAEDDALATRSTVPLPVQAYSQRLDGIISDLQTWINSPQNSYNNKNQDEKLQCVVQYLFDNCNYKVATESLDQTSPYRLYMHNVLAQRCGTTAALAVLLAGYLLRAQKKGIINSNQWRLGLPLIGGNYPIASYSEQTPAGSAIQYKWINSRGALAADVQQLKRSFWPWAWDSNLKYCFFPPAEAFLGEYGRAGTFTKTVGVLQPTGRPFGDLKKAANATERLMIIYGGMEGGILGAREARDMGILLCHLGRFQEALDLLSKYENFIDNFSDVSLIEDRERGVVKQVVVKLNKTILETAFNLEPAEKAV
eukprot:TRINITY_DN44270_c0_g1_i1.p2 TRINITY_DN44270_c0_g1~~TRINITY_DN44270_c0_g1_i1.p2  ORF type:complete len:396 (-),score=51.10 TRINITY_DN44270_c0_g1_i1:129-1316(-)